MCSRWRASRIPSRSLLAIAAVATFAGATPVAEASVVTPALPASAAQPLAETEAVTGLDLSPLLLSGYATSYAYGGAAIRDVLNGGTTVCVSTGSSACSTNGAP
jgi:hypothetical protein